MDKVLHSKKIEKSELIRAYDHICTAKAMSTLYEDNFKVVSKYVHATSRGHEVIQVALGMQLEAKDYLSAYYRDDAMLLAIGMEPYDLMLQLLAKKDDPFSGGRTYYCHPSLKDPDKPKIPHQSSATGMQGIPSTGLAMGIQYKEKRNLSKQSEAGAVTVCSFGDASITEGEVAEAFQMAALRQLPILYLVQDNEWDISAHASEIRANDASSYIQGFHGIECRTIDGTNFFESYRTVKEVLHIIRRERRPFMIHAKVPLLNHHTSGVRMEWYRDDLETQRLRDPFPIFRNQLLREGFIIADIKKIEQKAKARVKGDFERALQAEDPKPEDLFTHDFAPTPVFEETGERNPADGEEKVMVDCALFAIQELMAEHPECLLYGQDVGRRLGGVFREAATLAQKYGDDRVFNTPIQEAFIVGSTVGMSAVGLKPIVEVQFADYIWPGLNQLFTEVARSNYLSNGKWPVSMILRVPIGAYGSGGPYHSSSVESVVANIKGIKIAFPSNGADLKGLIKAAYLDPNPVVIFEHKGLYWSKVPGTHRARTIMPDKDYVLPFGKARLCLVSADDEIESKLTIVSYGMGVHWALNAAEQFPGRIEVVDIRTIYPLDEETIYQSVRNTNRCLVVTEETIENSFAQTLAFRVQKDCFQYLDAPVEVIGSENLPAIPLNSILEKTMIPSTEKVAEAIDQLLRY